MMAPGYTSARSAPRRLPLLLVIGAVLALLLGQGEAQAQCSPDCSSYNSNTACNTSSYSCVGIDLGGYGGGYVYYCSPDVYNVPPVGTACETDSNPCTVDACGGTAGQPNGDGTCYHNVVADGTACGANATCTGGACGCSGGYKMCGGACIPNATCCTSGDCAGGKVCSGAGGSCSCPGGSYDCSGTCIASSTCCNTPSNCPAPSGGNGTGACSGLGGSCSITCNGGYKVCGASCIPNAMCCTNADCPSDPVNNRSGVCTAGGCAYQCNPGYKACGATCIPSASCCANGDCMSPPNGCYKTAGTCAAGACTYPLNNGAACNADSNACTPNDKCNNGACVADTANQVVCVQRPCHTAPACNTTTGNCDDANLPNATACGGNGCAAPGTCTSGVCSSPDKDCSSLTAVCKVGICDPALPMATNCTTTNKMNGLACALTDKCQLAPACSGGECVGTPKSCTPSGPCRVSECNGATGDCEETVAAVGTSCAMAGSCSQNALCDATGNCNGDPVPDGSPCDLPTCTASAACVSGQCACLESPDFGADPQPLLPSESGAMANEDEQGGGGCAIGGHLPRANLLLALWLVLIAAFVRSRQQRV